MGHGGGRVGLGQAGLLGRVELSTHWIEQDLVWQGRVGQEQTALGREKHGSAVLNRSGQGLVRAEVIRTGRAPRAGQDWAGLGREQSIARQDLGLWKELLKERECSLSLETAIPELILSEYQEPTFPVFTGDCRPRQG